MLRTNDNQEVVFVNAAEPHFEMKPSRREAVEALHRVVDYIEAHGDLVDVAMSLDALRRIVTMS